MNNIDAIEFICKKNYQSQRFYYIIKSEYPDLMMCVCVFFNIMVNYHESLFSEYSIGAILLEQTTLEWN